jgi:hypothetical protein
MPRSVRGRGRIDRPDGTRLTAHSTLRDCSQTLEPEAERWSRHGGVLGRRTGTFALFRVLLSTALYTHLHLYPSKLSIRAFIYIFVVFSFIFTFLISHQCTGHGISDFQSPRDHHDAISRAQRVVVLGMPACSTAPGTIS